MNPDLLPEDMSTGPRREDLPFAEEGLSPLREIDCRIAETVFGLAVDYEFDEPRVPALADKYDEWGELPYYSSEIATAWLIVEKLRSEGWLVVIKEMPDTFPFIGDDEGKWKIHKRSYVHLQYMPDKTKRDIRRTLALRPHGFGGNAPEAICAAVLALREQEERFSE